MTSTIVSSPSPTPARSKASRKGSGSPLGYGPPTTSKALPLRSRARENASSCMVTMQ